MAEAPAEPAGWRPAQRWLHWTTALMAAAAFLVAWPMVALPFRPLLLKFVLYQVHKSLGLLVTLAVAARLALRWRHGRPAWDAGLGLGAIRAAQAGQALLYVLLLVVPALGYLAASSAPLRVPTLLLGLVPVPHLLAPDPELFALARQLHRGVAILLVVLAAGHAAFAVRHHARGRPVLAAMWPGARRPL
jgi:cytochrome b561